MKHWYGLLVCLVMLGCTFSTGTLGRTAVNGADAPPAGVIVWRDGKPVPVQAKMPLDKGDMIETPEGVTQVLHFVDSRAIMKPRTRVTIVNSLWVWFGELFSIGPLDSHTDWGDAVVDGTAYLVKSDPKAKTFVLTVVSGRVRFSPKRAGSAPRVLEAGSRLSLTGDREALETLSRDEYNSILRWVNQADERSSALLVPNVVGLAEAEATNLLRAFGINDVVVTKVLSQGHAVGEVVRQNPGAGESSSWARLDVVADPVVVPDLTGQTLSDAEGALSRLGLKRGLVDHQTTGRGPVGTVSAQNPTPGAAVAPGAQVTLVLEAAPAAPKPVEPVLVAVPRLLGSSRQAAVQALRRLKLSFVEERELSSDVRAPTVTAQNPDPDTRVAPGSSVTVTVLVPACTVPNLRELDPSGRKETLAAAEQIIKSAGLVPNVQAVGPAKAEMFAGIESQKPAAGTLVECGSTVTVQLRFAPPVIE